MVDVLDGVFDLLQATVRVESGRAFVVFARLLMVLA